MPVNGIFGAESKTGHVHLLSPNFHVVHRACPWSWGGLHRPHAAGACGVAHRLPRPGRPSAGSPGRREPAIRPAGSCRARRRRHRPRAGAVRGIGRPQPERAGDLHLLARSGNASRTDRRLARFDRTRRGVRSLPDSVGRLRTHAVESGFPCRRHPQRERHSRVRPRRHACVRFRLAAGRAALGKWRHQHDAVADACHRSRLSGAAPRQRAIQGLHPDPGEPEPSARPLWGSGRGLSRRPRRRLVHVGVAATQTPVDDGGRYLVIVDTERTERPSWAPAPGAPERRSSTPPAP